METKRELINAKTGQKIKFLLTGNETGGSLLEMEATYLPHSREPALHYHPFQQEHFSVLSGELHVRINNSITILKAGDSLSIPRAKVHSMWNAGENEAVVNWKVRPAMDTESFLRTFTGLANDNKTNEQGFPNLLQASLTVIRFWNTVRLAKPPLIVQYMIFSILKPVASLLGYKAAYQKYLV